MTTAVDWQYLAHNPVGGVRLPPGKPIKRAPVLSPERVRLVLANLQEPYRTMTALMAGTVIRESELLALKWRDFDVVQRVIRIRRSLYRGKIYEGTKTAEAAVIFLMETAWLAWCGVWPTAHTI